MSVFLNVKPETLGVVDDKYLGLLYSRVWSGDVVTYSYADLAQWETSEEYPINAVPADAKLRELVGSVLDEIEAVTNLEFKEVISDAHIDIFVNTKLHENGFAGQAVGPNGSGGYAAVAAQEPIIRTLYHEILHAVGLSHPDLTILPDNVQSGQVTIMYPANAIGYEDGYLKSFTPTDLLAHDIETLQQVYGINKSSSGNDDYFFDTADVYYEGLFDAGGTDTIHILD
ncbi:MAG: hypothetical protein AB3N28_01395, partial [Kordiimonas sp.]